MYLGSVTLDRPPRPGSHRFAELIGSGLLLAYGAATYSFNGLLRAVPETPIGRSPKYLYDRSGTGVSNIKALS